MRILLDTNLLVRAAITPKGSARAILRLIEKSEGHVLIISDYLLTEVADVLRRDRIRARWPLTDEEVRSYCTLLARIGEVVSAQPLPPIIEDPKDQAIIEAAAAGAAAVICRAASRTPYPHVVKNLTLNSIPASAH
ncbi:MAG: putative toxin-antitoxin system toxin component, PIN family [Acidobacteriia bacterium]|nr:putative toxin-antitoxin system toxin component, PIN family [Terriglobia bacterium]